MADFFEGPGDTFATDCDPKDDEEDDDDEEEEEEEEEEDEEETGVIVEVPMDGEELEEVKVVAS